MRVSITVQHQDSCRVVGRILDSSEGYRYYVLVHDGIIDPIWTLMVGYLMQKDTEDDGMTSNNGGGIGDIRDLAQSSPL